MLTPHASRLVIIQQSHYRKAPQHISFNYNYFLHLHHSQLCQLRRRTERTKKLDSFNFKHSICLRALAPRRLSVHLCVPPLCLPVTAVHVGSGANAWKTDICRFDVQARTAYESLRWPICSSTKSARAWVCALGLRLNVFTRNVYARTHSAPATYSDAMVFTQKHAASDRSSDCTAFMKTFRGKLLKLKHTPSRLTE